jgi:hypothetical protein
MDPVHGERGKFYYGIKCGNLTCQEKLALIEVPARPSWEEAQGFLQQIEGRTVRCPICTQETPVQARQTFVLAVQ